MNSKQSSLALTEKALEKIHTIDHSGYELRSVLATSDSALEEAKKYDQNGEDLPLGGIPILIKDNIEAVGLPGTAGSLALADAPVLRDAELVSLLRSAGAIIVGATNLSEWANIRSTKSTSGWSAVGGLTANAWQHERSAGGSSSGSGAAVSAGLTQWAIGSETDGSIICPASLNGVVGIKPTVGLVSRAGVIPISTSQDSPGPLSQTVEQAALLLEVLTGKTGYKAAAQSNQSLKIGVVQNWKTNDAGTNALFEETLATLAKSGFAMQDIELKEPSMLDSHDETHVLLHELSEDLEQYLQGRAGSKVKTLGEVIEFNRKNAERELAHFQQELFEDAVRLGGRTDEYESKRARNLAWANGVLAAGLTDFDVLLGCTYGPAWKSNLGGGDNYDDASWITMAPAIAGAPIGSIPMGLVSGMPVGLGFVAGRNQEALLIAAMAQVERALGIGVLTPTFLK